MKRMKNILLPILIVFTLGMVYCAEDENVPTTLIFDGVERIELTSPDHLDNSSGPLVYSAPSEVAFIVVGIFNSSIQTSGKTILNEANFFRGIKTGLAGFNRGQLDFSATYIYDQNSNDFDGPSALPNGSYYWAVWGYDSNGILTHASPQWRFTYP